MRKTRLLMVLSVCACAALMVSGAKGQSDFVSLDAAQTSLQNQESVDGFFPLPFVPPGACELPNGDCVVTLDTICRVAGGEFQGPNTECD